MKSECQQQAHLIAQLLPFIRKLSGKVIVVKAGGRMLADDSLRNSFGRDVSLLALMGLRIVVVHGGGPQINAKLSVAGIREQRIDGLRVTDAAIMEVVDGVLNGEINALLANSITTAGGTVKRLSGAKQLLFGREIDRNRLGLVGEVKQVNHKTILDLPQQTVAVISPVARNEADELLNVNADAAAAAIAAELKAKVFLLLTDTDGILDSQGKLVPELDMQQVNEYIDSGTITAGMVPKANCVLGALGQGVTTCKIINGTVPHTLLQALLTASAVGSVIVV